MESNTYGSPSGSGDGGDFFGGTVVPHAPQQQVYADFSAPASAPPTTRPSVGTWLALAVVGALVVAAGYFGYRTFFGSSIEMPDTLMGMERIDPDSALGRELERSLSGAEMAAGAIDFEVAGYTSADRMLFVAAADSGAGDLEQDAFFSGLATGLKTGIPGVALKEVDAGSAGGRMQCMEVPAAAAGACAWISDETVGVVVTTGGSDDIAATTIEVRDIVVQ